MPTSNLNTEITTTLGAGTEAALNSINKLFKNLSINAGKAAKSMVGLDKVKLDKPISAAAKSMDDTANAMAKASKNSEELSKANAKTIDGADKINRSFVELRNSTFSLDQRNKKFAETMYRVAPAVAKVDTALHKSRKAFGYTYFQTNKLGASLDTTTKMLNGLREGLTGVVDKLKSFAGYIVASAVFLTLSRGIGAAVSAMFDYDQALHDLKAITQATDVETEKMGETIKEVAASTKFSTVEIAEGMRTLGQAGFSAEEAVKAIKGISDLATGTLSDMGDAVDLVSTALRVFDMEASEAASVSDTFANAINGSKLTMDKLRVAFNYIGPIAKLAGIEFKDLTSTMMVLGNKGLRASTIGTGLRQVLNKILKPTQAFKDAVANAGMTLDDLNPKTNSMRDVIGKLGLVVQDADQAFEMFGMRGAAAVSAMLEGGTFQFDKMRSLVDRTGMAAKMAGEQLLGLTLRLKQLGDKFTVFFAELRDQGLAEPLGWIIDGGRKAMDTMIFLAKNGLMPVIKVLTLLSVAIAAVTFKNLIVGSTLLTAAYTKLTVASTAAIASIKGVGIAIKTTMASVGPLGWVLMALGTAMAFVVKSFIGYSERLRETVEESEKLMTAMDRLNDEIDKTKLSLVGIQEGSDEYKKGLEKLKNEIENTAKEFPQLRDEAKLVIDSMDTLNGKFIDGGKALETFETALDGIKFDAASDRIKAFDASLESSLFWGWITGKIKTAGKAFGKSLWDNSPFAMFFKLADSAIDRFSNRFDGFVDFISSKAFGVVENTFVGMEEASKGGGKALDNFNNLLIAGKDYIRDWGNENGVALEKLSTEELEKLSYEIAESLDLSDRMRISMVRGATEIAEAFKKQGVGSVISQWEKDFNMMGDSIVGLRYQLTQQGDIFAPFKKSLDTLMGEQDWTKLFDLESEKTTLATELKEIERLYADNLIGIQEYTERKFTLGKRFNEVDRQLKNDEKFQTVQQFAELNAARNKELENLKIHADRYSKEQQEMMKLEIDDKYLAKSVDLLYKLDEKRKAAADNFEKTEKDIKEKIANSWEDYYADMESMAKELSDKRADLAEKSSEKILSNNISLNRKLRDLKSASLKDEINTALASKDIYADLSNAKRALDRGDKESAVQYAASAQKALSSLDNTGQAAQYAKDIADIYKRSGKEVTDYQISLQNDVRAVRDKEVLAQRLDAKAKGEMSRDLSNARRALAKGDAEAAMKYAKSAEASLKDVKDIRSVIDYVNNIRKIMNESEKELLAEKQRNLTQEYSEKRNARKTEMDESLADNQLLMAAAKKKFNAESQFLDETLRLQKRNTRESIKGTNAQIKMYQAAKRTAAKLASMSSGGVVVPGYAEGGEVFSRPTDAHITSGSGLRDDVPALLKKNEYVVRSEAVSKYGVGFLKKINSGLFNLKNFSVPKFASGGLVGATAGFSGGESMINVNLNLPTSGRVIPLKMSQPNASEFINQLKNMEKMSS